MAHYSKRRFHSHPTHRAIGAQLRVTDSCSLPSVDPGGFSLVVTSLQSDCIAIIIESRYPEQLYLRSRSICVKHFVTYATEEKVFIPFSEKENRQDGEL